MTIFLKDALIFLISKMLGPQFRGGYHFSNHLAHLCYPLPEPCSVITLPSSCFCWETFPWLFFLPCFPVLDLLLSWPPFLQRKLTFTYTFDQLWSILYSMHLDPCKRAPARPCDLCALPWLCSAVFHSMGWKVCRVKKVWWPLKPPATQTWSSEFPTPLAPASF